MGQKWRFLLIVFALVVGMSGLIWRMVDLMIFNRAFLSEQGNARSLRVVDIPAYRGMIADRHGDPMAISTPVDSVWANPKEFSKRLDQITKLSKILKISVSKIEHRVRKHRNKSFIYLKRHITPFVGEQIKALKIPGVFLKREFRRYYPEGEVAAQLIGFTNIDDQGQGGIELEYNRWLQGVSGKKRVLVDRGGNIVSDVDLINPSVPGHNLILSIDRRIQFLAYRVLKEAMQKYKARSCSVVVLDVETGEVLAMGNQPSFNPNNRPSFTQGRFRNRAMTDVFEPGSTIKAFSVANALASGKYAPTTPINTSNGRIFVEGKVVEDDANYGLLNVTGVLQKSSNVGVTKMTLSLPTDSLPNLLRRVGFGKRTITGFPGESPGVLADHKDWKKFVLSTLSFGYGLSVTNLQLAQAYAELANRGIKYPVSLLRVTKRMPGKRAMSTKVANEILLMMESVVEKGGTATKAQVPGYRVSGKTGTVRIVGPKGYEKNHHTAIFVGIAPISHPKLVVSVVVKDPRGGKFYGGLVAAPIFAKVMGGALRILDIPPDH